MQTQEHSQLTITVPGSDEIRFLNGGKILVSSKGLPSVEAKISDLNRRIKKLSHTAIELRGHGEHQELNDSNLTSVMNELGILETQEHSLETLLTLAELIEDQPFNYERVQPGAKVSVEQDGGKKDWVILGPFESDPDNGIITMVAPIAQALLTHEVGDEINFNNKLIKIISISRWSGLRRKK